jgi:hypothetical protein
MDFKILRREESLKIIQDETFVAAWQSLAKASKEFTLIQEPDLVVSWYKAYQNQYDPLMVVAYIDEKLVAVLPLAISQDDGGISHAGHGQAEYNGWIAKQEIEEEFLIESLILLKQQCGLSKWDWGWMPPHANTDWLQSDKLKAQGIYVNLGHCELPVYDLTDTIRIAKIKKSKSTKSKINRLKRAGDLKIERITDLARAKEVFGDLKKISNFRNLAVYDNMPFVGENSNKEQWHLDHLNGLDSDGSDSVHFTVLWQGDEFLACNFGFCSDDTVIIGLFTYNPVQGAHSPGNVFLIELINFITEEGFKTLDLSPGGDPYKERFCNKHITLTKPVFTFSKAAKVKTDAITFVKNKVKEKYSYRDIEAFKTKLKKKANEFRKKANNEYELFKFSSLEHSADDLEVACQKFDDLLLYKETDGYKKQSEVVFSSLKNFERGDFLYTFVKEGELLFYTWVSVTGKKHWNEKLNEITTVTGNNILFYETYFVEGKINTDRLLNVRNKIIGNHRDKDDLDVFMVKPLLVSNGFLSEVGLEKVS